MRNKISKFSLCAVMGLAAYHKGDTMDLLYGCVTSQADFFFLFLFLFRYLRLLVHLLAFWFFYRPAEIPKAPTFTSRDVTVIVPTVDPRNKDFGECIERCLLNNPKEVIIVVSSEGLVQDAEDAVANFRKDGVTPKISVTFTEFPNKRHQIVRGIEQVTTPIIVLLDDHVFWRSPNFLQSILAPFEDPKVAGVGSNKRARRTSRGLTPKSFWNMMGDVYLQRGNFSAAATSTVDGGISCLSGRTSAHRTCLLQQQEFKDGFTNERFFFGMFGPLNADDDKYITRYYVRKGYTIKFQITPDSLIETTLGEYPKFLSQCARWTRTTWRSNSASLFTDRTVWTAQPWCTYAVHLYSFFNFALFYDAALLYSFCQSTYYHAFGETVKYLVAWMFIGRTVKWIPHFFSEPQDLVFLPAYYAFAYYYSFVKLYTLVTFWDTKWGGRQLP